MLQRITTKLQKSRDEINTHRSFCDSAAERILKSNGNYMTVWILGTHNRIIFVVLLIGFRFLN